MTERRDNPKTKPQRDYHKTHTTPFIFRLNNKTDADIISHLSGLDNKQGYVKRLIRADMERNGSRWRDEIGELIDNAYTVERTESGALIFTPKK
jgi:hypothetical protein